MFVKLLGRVVPAWVWAVVIGLVAAGGVGWWGVTAWEARIAEQEALAQELATMTANRDRWQQRTQQLLEQQRAAQERARQAEAAVAELQAALAERDADYREIQRRIRQAPAEDDGPVAPVLRQALEALP
ncbi:hypothetical protein [Billgrantia gudaonensis]|uniref:Uncharacterized protein n=1 Tax=Billgrantia gudaonensis TaxID=376427 RepID=A0A1G9AVV8_9GAMM|nr:hypothetical protein [Halomonas gudaonensis]SDK31432.1 hypothetical protein SAMN04487954_114106 [Halomonas gudaonensis]